jgi:hypothetical protein
MNPGHVFAVFDAQQGLRAKSPTEKRYRLTLRFGRDWRELLTESLITRWRALSPGWKLAVMEGRMTGRMKGGFANAQFQVRQVGMEQGNS